VKVSVITVCYNAQAHIAQTIESVLGQDHQDLEYIVVDGNSTDGTVDIIRKYAGDPRLQWRSEPDAGIADAMNKGVALASGEVVAHLNADDYYAHPRVISRVAEYFRRNPATLWLTGGFDFVSADGVFLRSIRVRRYSSRRLVRGNIILHPATFIRYDAFSKAGGFDASLHYCMDYDLFLRLDELAPPCLLDEQLSCFRVHSSSRTIMESEQSYAEEFQVRSRFLRQRGRSVLLYRLAYQLKKHLNRRYYRKLFSAMRDGGQS
jgi:glycosyltransferase involved in cell wall biosynthesis